MSDEDKKYDLIGTISGFNVVSTDPNNPTDARVEHNYTLADLFNEVQRLKNILDTEQLSRLESLITKHLSDYDNPHKVSLETLKTSVLAELYKEWLALGNVGGTEDFLKVLFQYVLIADIPETIEGKALDKLTSVRGVATLVDIHNKDPYAHEEVFDRVTPGDKWTPFPSFSFHSFIGIPQSIKVTRDSVLYTVGPDGYLKENKANTIAADYTFENAAIPVFRGYHNLVTQSEEFSSKFVANGSSLVRSSVPDLRSNAGAYTIIENGTFGEHSVTSNENISVTAGTTYNLSVFIRSNSRNNFGIRLEGNPLNGDYQLVQFNMNTQQTFVSDAMDKNRLNGEIYRLPNRWYRCCITFTPVRSTSLNYTFYPIDIFDGDSSYQGSTDKGMFIFGVQLTQSNVMLPYIPSMGSRGYLAPTTLIAETEDWFSHTDGTIVVKCMNSQRISDARTHYLYSIGNANSSVCLEARYPNDPDKRLFFSSHKAGNGSLATKWSAVSDRDEATYVHSYQLDKHIFGYFDRVESDINEVTTTAYVNSAHKYLYIGTDRFGGNHLDNYIESFVYYPACCRSTTIPFFLGETESWL